MSAPSDDLDATTRLFLSAARGGDRSALDALLRREWPRLRRRIAARVGPGMLHRVELDDLVQETFTEALRRLPQYEHRRGGGFTAWLTTLAEHRLANLRRTLGAARRDAGREQPMPGAGSTFGRVTLGPGDPAPGPRTLVASAEAIAQVNAALAELSEDDREVIRLARTDGLPLADVALRMGRTRNAVALLLSRALRKLQARLHARE